MNKTIEALAYIERQAQALADWDKPGRAYETLAAEAQAETDRRVRAARREAEEAIAMITLISEAEREDKVKRVHAGHAEALARLEALFARHTDAWRERIVACVLEA